MSRRRLQNLCLTVLALAAVLCALCAPALAQCAMCKASASGLDGLAARHMNEAVLVLVSPPVGIFCAFLYLTYKKRRPPGGDDDE